MATAMIVSTPGTCGGKPRIEGHRIRVQDVVVWVDQMGMTVDQIESEYPGMTPDKISAALSYYANHRDEIDADLKHEEELADSLDRFPGSALDRLSRMSDAGKRASSPG
jgi:uncharacterized protein (DUF433 family)